MPKLIRITTSPIAFRYLLKNQMKFMRSAGIEVIMISSSGPDVTEVVANEQCRFIPVEMSRAITPLKDIVSIIRLVRIFRKERPDIVHTHTPKAGMLGMIASRIAAVPIRIHSNSGTPLIIAKGLKRVMYFITEWITCKTAMYVLPNSQSLLDFLKREGVCNNRKLIILGKGSTNGINCDEFNNDIITEDQKIIFKKRIGWDPQCFYFLFVGRLMTSKGVKELVNAFIKLYEEYGLVRLILAGNIESHIDRLSDEILDKINTHRGIHSLGWVSDIRTEMSVADVFIHPSYREGFPNVLLQAGAMKLPVICSNCIGNVDIITPNVTGLMFPVKNENRLYRAMKTAIKDTNLLQEYSNNLYKNVIEHYSIQIVQNNLLSFYNKQINERLS